MLFNILYRTVHIEGEPIPIALALTCMTMFCRYTDTGFTVTGKSYEGSVLCIGNLILSWTPKTFAEITADR